MLTPVRVLVVALLALAASTVTAQARETACGPASARAAVRATHLKMKLLGPDLARVDPASVDQVICFDFTRDGRLDVAATIASGGTAGDIGFVVFRATPAGWRVALTSGGYKLGLVRIGGDVVATQPIYKSNDANCCPTGGFDHVRYHWNGSRFARARVWHTKTFRP
jgi:hypothetical protein